MARWHSCIVLQTGNSSRRLWQFAAGGDKFTLQRDETRLPGEALPEKIFAKDWPTLFQPKLNIAWLPPQEVFLRVLQLPKSDPAETQSMIELQLEKVSPLPQAQIVWTYDLVPHAGGDMQTAIVIIAARSQVEKFLGELETEGYLADRVELPVLDQLRITEINEDGVWIYPGLGADNYSCLVAWWYGGILHNLSLLHLPPGDKQPQVLREHLTQMSWAGEIEGWLVGAPRYHIVTDPQAATAWTSVFAADESVVVTPPLPPEQVAALTARRATSEDKRLNLLPPEFTARYRQKLVDRLWIRALVAMLGLYVLGVVLYMGWAQFARWQVSRVTDRIAQLGPSYTNTIRLKEEARVLQDQINLKFAALDSWKSVADNLPTELTLEALGFDSKKLTIRGTAPSDNIKPVYEFIERLRESVVNDKPVFLNVTPGPIRSQAGNQSSWVVYADLKQQMEL